MPNFYSPEGNFEVWEKKPKGYFTVEEWQAAHPSPKPTPTPFTIEDLAACARDKRDKLLSASDKYLVVDFPIDANKLEDVKAYREELRKLPEQEGFPKNIQWPTNPMCK